MDDVEIPDTVLLRMAIISENHLKGEYEYMRKIVASHEKELAVVWLLLALAVVVDYYLIVKVYKMDKEPNVDPE